MSETFSTVVLTQKPNYTQYNKEHKIDKEFGIEAEDECLPILKLKFDEFLIKNSNKFAIFDYVGSKTFIELKTRRYESTKYPDTMIGCNKIKNALKVIGRKVIFVFKFTDDIYYWEFNKETLEAVSEVRLGGRIDRGVDERRPYYFIKINAMSKLEN